MQRKKFYKGKYKVKFLTKGNTKEIFVPREIQREIFTKENTKGNLWDFGKLWSPPDVDIIFSPIQSFLLLVKN